VCLLQSTVGSDLLHACMYKGSGKAIDYLLALWEKEFARLVTMYLPVNFLLSVVRVVLDKTKGQIAQHAHQLAIINLTDLIVKYIS
jgi:hypothetical protein